MHQDRNLQVLELLANGINPINKEEFPADHPCQNPEVIRALFNAITMIARSHHFHSPKKIVLSPGEPAKKGVPWTKEEDRSLIEAFKENVSLEQLAKQHERSQIAIEKRLMKLGLLPSRYVPAVATPSDPVDHVDPVEIEVPA